MGQVYRLHVPRERRSRAGAWCHRCPERAPLACNRKPGQVLGGQKHQRANAMPLAGSPANVLSPDVARLEVPRAAP
jgi:hypothetical protein